MRFLAGLSQPASDKAAPFSDRPCRVRSHTLRLSYLRLRPRPFGACQQLSGLPTALSLREAPALVAPVACGAATASFGRASSVPRPSGPPLRCGTRPEMGRMPLCGDSLWRKRIKAGWRRPTRGQSNSIFLSLIHI